MTLRTIHILFAFVLTTVLALPAWAADADDGHRIVGLLDYVGADYGVAVQKGEVVNDFEYREMHDLSDAAAELAEENGDPELTETIGQLRRAIGDKAALREIRDLTLKARGEAIDAYGITLAPSNAPDFASGKRSYAEHCASCHAEDGTAGVPGTEEMEPQPVDFTDPERRSQLSPYRAYNTTTYGVEGTPMAAYGHLPDSERWDLAFYVMALGHGAEEQPAALPQDWSSEFELATLARLKDFELKARLADRGVPESEADQRLRQLRTAVTFRAYETADTSDALKIARQKLDAAEAAVQSGQWSDARNAVLASYLEGFEPVETQLNSMDGALTREVEGSYLDLREAIKKEDSTLAAERLTEVRGRLDQADQLLASDTTDFALASAAAFIALREGVEVVLLLALLLGVVGRLGERRARKYVHGGWITAVVAGVATWFAASSLIEISGAQRELLEGVVALLAAAVLFSVSYWFIGKVQGERWTQFIKSKLANKIEGGQLISIAGVSFLAVYREAFETVLFYQALLIEADGNLVPVLGGVAFAVVLLAGIAVAVFRLGAKLPLKQFFAASAVGLYLLCVILAGNGLHALVEAGIYEPILISGAPTIPILGIYPDAIGLSLQAALLVAAAVWFVRSRLTRPSSA